VQRYRSITPAFAPDYEKERTDAMMRPMGGQTALKLRQGAGLETGHAGKIRRRVDRRPQMESHQQGGKIAELFNERWRASGLNAEERHAPSCRKREDA